MRCAVWNARFLFAAWIALTFVVVADGSSAEDISRRYASLAELFAADAYVTAEQVPFERVSDSVVDCRFFEGRQLRQISVHPRLAHVLLEARGAEGLGDFLEEGGAFVHRRGSFP